MDSIIKDKDD